MRLLSLTLAAAASSALLTLPARAGYNCITNSLGMTSCYGTINGQSVNTQSTTNSLGQTTTTGTVNGQPFRQSCITNSLGMTSCF